MATPRTGRPRGRPEGFKKAWRSDPDRHVIAMATGLWHVLDISLQTAIRLALLCHYHDPIRFAAHMARRLNLRPKVQRRIAEGWRLEVFREHPDDNAEDPHGAYLKASLRRLIRQWHRWHGETEFEIWRTQMAIVWQAVVCARESQAAALKHDVALRCSWVGETIYANSILIPLINQAFRLNS